MNDSEPRSRYVAYLGLLGRPDGAGTMLAIAGVHAIGSLGVAVWLRDHLAEVYDATEGRPFSMVIGSERDGLTITGTEALCPPRSY